MTALSQDRNTPIRDGGKFGYPVAANAVCFGGGLVGIDASGYAAPMTLATGLTCVGIAEFRADNSNGAAGAITVVAMRKRSFRFMNGASLTLANVGQTAYALDDITVTNVATGASEVGVIENVDSVGVWVYI